MKANSDQFGEVVAYEIQSPQTSTNPAKIVSSPKNKNCRISVSFTGSFDEGMGNGPSTINVRGEAIYGLGFTVSGVVPSRGIGHIGSDVNRSNPNGAWMLQQYRWNYTKVNNAVTGNDRQAVQELGSGVPYRIQGNRFAWYDHPGIPSAGLPSNPVKSAIGNWKFIAKAVNGKKECQVAFYVNVTFDGNWQTEWGEIRP